MHCSETTTASLPISLPLEEFPDPEVTPKPKTKRILTTVPCLSRVGIAIPLKPVLTYTIKLEDLQKYIQKTNTIKLEDLQKYIQNKASVSRQLSLKVTQHEWTVPPTWTTQY